jgi:hypothetical protein
MSQNSSGVQID